jgi:antibiotic biosynthesis monooxygenase (ABM) superfamily enzyme
MEKESNTLGDALTIVVQHEIKGGFEDKFKAISDEFTAALKKFPGFMGKNIFLHKTHGKTIYSILLRFQDLASVQQWEASDIRNQLKEKLEALVGLQSQYHYLTGLETWFALRSGKPMVPPPRYKMALLTWIGVYTLLLFVNFVFGQFLMPLPLAIRLLVVSVVLVCLMTYVVMPFLVRRLVKWLYPN